MHNRIQQTNVYSVKKIYLFLENNVNTAAKSILVQLCYYMTREFSSTESTAKYQFLQKSSSKLLKSRAAVLVKENTITVNARISARGAYLIF